jgi:hypothetical protein
LTVNTQRERHGRGVGYRVQPLVSTDPQLEQINTVGAALAILGGIAWRADPDSIRIRQYAGSPANMLWVKIDGKDYAFRYEHSTGRIEIRDNSQNGPILHAIDDTMSVPDIHAIMQAL